MTVLVQEAAPTAQTPQKHQTNNINTEERYPLPELPKLDRSWGYKTVQNEQSGEFEEAPLTLLDLLYPSGEEIFVAEGWIHRWLSVMLEVMMRAHLAPKGWVVFGNVFIHWGRPNVPPIAPDVTAIPTGRYPTLHEGSYHVGRHGPNPSFVIEITSHNKPERDVERKKWDYEGLAVPEYLIIDLWSELSKPWRLLGYRLKEDGFYTQLQPDAEGGLTFVTVGLRFVIEGAGTIAVYDAASGEKLTLPEEWQQQAKQAEEARRTAEARAEAESVRAENEAIRAANEAARAEAEAQARAAAEAELAALTARLRELEARLGGDPPAAP